MQLHSAADNIQGRYSTVTLTSQNEASAAALVNPIYYIYYSRVQEPTATR